MAKVVLQRVTEAKVEVDGEVVGYTPVRLEVVENQINVLVPSDAVL